MLAILSTALLSLSHHPFLPGIFFLHNLKWRRTCCCEVSKAISCGSKGKCFGHAKNVEETANVQCEIFGIHRSGNFGKSIIKYVAKIEKRMSLNFFYLFFNLRSNMEMYRDQKMVFCRVKKNVLSQWWDFFMSNPVNFWFSDYWSKPFYIRTKFWEDITFFVETALF